MDKKIIYLIIAGFSVVILFNALFFLNIQSKLTRIDRQLVGIKIEVTNAASSYELDELKDKLDEIESEIADIDFGKQSRVSEVDFSGGLDDFLKEVKDRAKEREAKIKANPNRKN
jgi:hypothetical protein